MLLILSTMPSTTSPKTALITGASGGIGYALTEFFARDGYNLVLVARSRELLEQQARELGMQYGVAVKVLAKDLTEPNASEEIFQDLQQEGIHIDALVNNAGFGLMGAFAESDWKKQNEMIQVNLVSLTQLTQLFLPAMVANKNGKILNVASLGAFMPGPFNAVYHATKAYVLSLSEGLASELSGSGVTVTCLCPGATATGFQARAFGKDAERLASVKRMSSEEVAAIGYQAMQKGELVSVPGFGNKVTAWMVKFLPLGMVLKQYRKRYAPGGE
jgi:short-subunit dehydrogenase